MQLRNINTYNTSHEKAFEALSNQIFERWVRKECKVAHFSIVNGAGGDGGVESYAVMEDGKFAGVQAKWFLESLNASQINQIRKSINSALTVRPTMSQYIICLPRDFQSDKIGRGKKLVEDTEEKRINELIDEFSVPYPDLKIEFWNESRIRDELQKPGAEGIVKFWFSKEILSFDFIKNRFELAKSGWLKERYTPSLHAQGEIHSIVQLALYTRESRIEVIREMERFLSHAELTQRLIHEFNHLAAGAANPFQAELETIQQTITKYVQLFQTFRNQVKNGEQLSNQQHGIVPVDFWTTIHKLDTAKLNPTFNNVQPRLSLAFKKLAESDLPEYVNWSIVQNRSHNCGIMGLPGSGKTHGVADEVELRLKEAAPAVIIQAKTTPCSNWTDILHHTLGGLKDWTDVEIFTAFEAMVSRVDVEKAEDPQSSEIENELTKFLIVIDGIDEAENMTQWRDRIKELTHWITQFPRIRFVFTARSYGPVNENPSQLHFDDANVRFDLPDEGDVPLLELAQAYFRTYNIDYQNFPWLLTAFENALSLKLFCEEYKGKDLATLENPVIFGFRSLLNNKINRIDTEFTEQHKPGWSSTDQVVRQALVCIADTLVLKTFTSHNELASKLVADTNGLIDRNWASKLIDTFCDHGILLKEETPSTDGISPSSFSYSITFQSYIDYFISIKAINDVPKSGTAIPDILKSRKNWNPIRLSAISLFNDLGIMVGEKNYWVRDLNPDDIRILQYEVISNSSTDKIKQYLPDLKKRFLSSPAERNEIINYFILPNLHRKELRIGREFIHDTLVGFKNVFERDLFWSGPDKFSGNEKLNLGKLFTGVQLLPFHSFDDIPLVLAWSLTATDNVHREQARKELTRWGYKNPDELIKILDLLFFVGDPQLQEDLSTIMMGISSLNTNPGQGQKQLANWILNNVFTIGKTINIRNSVVRHCCRAVVERAFSLGECGIQEVERARPPYKSDPTPLILDLAGKKGHRGERFPIVHDLAWYVIDNSYEDLLNADEDERSEEAKGVLEKYEILYSRKLSPHEFAISAAIGFIKNLGWNRLDGPGYTEESHGSISKLATLEEKYTWLAVHEIQGYLLDLVPFKSYYNEYDRIKDYSLIIHVPNPAITGSFEDDLTHTEILENKWYVPENIAPTMSLSNDDLAASITAWVNREETPDFQKWINIPDQKIEGQPYSRDFQALTIDSNFTESNNVGRTRLQIINCLIDNNKALDFIEFFKTHIGKLKRMFFNDLEQFQASPETTTYTSVKDVVWMSWMRENYSVQEIDDGKGSTFEILKAISKVTENSMEDGEKYFQIPSKIIRENLNIVNTDKVKYIDNNDAIQIVFCKTGDNWENGQERLMVDAKSFSEFLKRENLFPFWLAFQIHTTTAAATKMEGFAHSQNCRFWLIWEEGSETKSFLFHNDHFK